jgi:hypothetical protein
MSIFSMKYACFTRAGVFGPANMRVRLALMMTCVLVFALRAEAQSAVDTATHAESVPSHRETVMLDLFAVITLSGQQCQEVVDYEMLKEMDYVAICKNGQRYRIDVTPQGQVRVGTHKRD